MKSSLQDYKKYPYPVWFLILYFVITAIAIIPLHFAARLLTLIGVNKIEDILVAIPILIIVLLIICAIMGGIISLLTKTKKSYRGIGFYNFMMTISIISPIIAIGLIAYIITSQTDITFMLLFTPFIESFMPLGIMVVMRKRMHRCKKCGLINTMNNPKKKNENLGRHVKYHEGAGYYKDVVQTTRGSGYQGGYRQNYEVEVHGKQYVHRVVRDGQFEKKRVTTIYTCCVCHFVEKKITETDTKVAD